VAGGPGSAGRDWAQRPAGAGGTGGTLPGPQGPAGNGINLQGFSPYLSASANFANRQARAGPAFAYIVRTRAGDSRSTLRDAGAGTGSHASAIQGPAGPAEPAGPAGTTWTGGVARRLAPAGAVASRDPGRDREWPGAAGSRWPAAARGWFVGHRTRRCSNCGSNHLVILLSHNLHGEVCTSVAPPAVMCVASPSIGLSIGWLIYGGRFPDSQTAVGHHALIIAAKRGGDERHRPRTSEAAQQRSRQQLRWLCRISGRPTMRGHPAISMAARGLTHRSYQAH